MKAPKVEHNPMTTSQVYMRNIVDFALLSPDEEFNWPRKFIQATKKPMTKRNPK